MAHGMIISGGKKMSKTIGNVVDPEELIEEYGAEALRYYFAREISPFEDGDIGKEKFQEAYNANLANGLGNLVARIMKMAEDNLDEAVLLERIDIPKEFVEMFDNLEIQKASDIVWREITKLDEYIQTTKPFSMMKENPEEAKKIISELVQRLYKISVLLTPFLPETAEKIQDAIRKNKKPEALFLRKS